jgi:hypothetical protein
MKLAAFKCLLREIQVMKFIMCTADLVFAQTEIVPFVFHIDTNKKLSNSSRCFYPPYEMSALGLNFLLPAPTLFKLPPNRL